MSTPRWLRAVLLLALSLPSGGAAGAEEIDLTLHTAGARLFLHLDDGAFAIGREALVRWVERSAYAVRHYYGRFPVAEVYIALRAVPGKGVMHGRAFAEGDATINVSIGSASDALDLERDWIMVHEMIHLALPQVPDRHTWLEEGLAVYVESIARANVGQLSPEFVWHGFVQGMPHGQPAPGDLGLDHTPTWGRTYWGGALFCLLADIEIRVRTGNRKSLRDALRAIVAADLSMLNSSALGPLLEIGDAATGERVLQKLYAAHRSEARPVDLDTLWNRLGVRAEGSAVRLDDAAPLAGIRRSITARDDPAAALPGARLAQGRAQ